MREENNIKNRINELIKVGALSIEVLSEAIGIEEPVLLEFLFQDADEVPKSVENPDVFMYKMYAISDGLVDGMQIADDERVRAIIDVLVQSYKMDYKMISGYAGIKEQEVRDFVEKSEDLSYTTKYHLAVKAFSLVQVMRNM